MSSTRTWKANPKSKLEILQLEGLPVTGLMVLVNAQVIHLASRFEQIT
jgi:hypothetical protein